MTAACDCPSCANGRTLEAAPGKTSEIDRLLGAPRTARMTDDRFEEILAKARAHTRETLAQLAPRIPELETTLAAADAQVAKANDLCEALREFEGETLLAGERMSPYQRRAFDRATRLRKEFEALQASVASAPRCG